MFHLRMFLIASVFWSVYAEDRRPLTDYIKHYETLNYDPSGLHAQHERARRDLPGSEPVNLKFKAHGRAFKIRLRRDTELFTDDFAVDDNAEFDPAKVYVGHVVGDTQSLVHGFIHKGVFEGKIHVGNDIYHVETAKKYFKNPDGFHSVIFNSADVHYPHTHGHSCGISEKTKKWMRDIQTSIIRPSFKHEGDVKFEPVLNRYRRAASSIDDKKKTCTLFMQADHLFTAEIGGGDKERALLKMSEHVKAITSIYKKEPFNDQQKPDGIQFVIKRMKANGTDEQKRSDNPYSNNNIGVEKLLEINSLNNHDGFCLAYVFTYRDFADGVLGLAWVAEEGSAAGGICETYSTFSDGKKKSLNTGVVTFINYGKEIPQKVSEITFAHEAGHNFGSPHDPPGPCAPGEDGNNYIMFASATSGDQPNNRRFSSCSLKKMTGVLQVKGICTDEKCCFIAPQSAICGNKVVEEGEECDCGYEDECNDDCCVGQPIDGNPGTGCMRKRNVSCSPSQGMCCTSDCKFKTGNKTNKCLAQSQCNEKSFCNGSSATCPSPTPRQNGTLCNENRSICVSGSCSDSICSKYNKKECQCKEEDFKCHVCCEVDGTCKPTKEITGMVELKQSPGAPCDDFNGYCDVFLKCRKVDADGPLARLKNMFFSKQAIMGYLQWIKTYWWAVVLMGVGLILLMAGFIKVCSVHTPSSNPNRKPARQLTLRRSQRQPPNRRAPRNQRPPASDAAPPPNNPHYTDQPRGATRYPRDSRAYDEPPPAYPGGIELHGPGRY